VAVDGWAVTFGTARRGLGGLRKVKERLAHCDVLLFNSNKIICRAVCVSLRQNAVWVAMPHYAASRTRETVISVRHLHRPPTDKHDRQKLDVGVPEPEVEAETSAAASPVPSSDWEAVFTRDTTVEGQVTAACNSQCSSKYY